MASLSTFTLAFRDADLESAFDSHTRVQATAGPHRRCRRRSPIQAIVEEVLHRSAKTQAEQASWQLPFPTFIRRSALLLLTPYLMRLTRVNQLTTAFSR